jgi:DNA-binding beta-propeller fold protein YncE
MTPDSKIFGACPGPVNTANFSPHGLAIREHSEYRYHLYMTSHGEREAIEVFDVDASGVKPAIAWIGCVVLPEKTFANSVAILDDGGFVTTKMMDSISPEAFAAVRSGGITGLVYEWHPGGEVEAVAGTELGGANGIEVSPDQRWLFVAAFGSREIVRFDRNSKPMARQSVQIGITPDNLRWTPNGKLYTVGGNFLPPAESAECASPPCSTGWSVYEIDPETLQVIRVTGMDQTAALQGASTALPVGDEIWVGTYSGDRVGYLPKP